MLLHHHHASLLKIVNKTGSLFRDLGALRLFLSFSLSLSLSLSLALVLCSLRALHCRRSLVSTKMSWFRSAYFLYRYHVVLLSPMLYPSPLLSLAFLFFRCDDIDGIEQLTVPPLDLRLILSARLSHRRRVSSMLSVAGRRRVPQFVVPTSGSSPMAIAARRPAPA